MNVSIDDYLARIGLGGRPDATVDGLAQVQMAHRMSIGFENMDVMLGRPIRVDLAGIWAKFGPHPWRGGYCFEQNTLFGAMLADLGFANRALMARVWLGLEWGGEMAAAPPRTHTLRLVSIEGQEWIADAGFGGSYVPPMPLIDGAQGTSPDGAHHRLRRVDSPLGVWLLERMGPATATDGRVLPTPGFQPQYSFDLTHVAPVDIELANHWTSTRPDTRFTSNHLASIVLADGFASMNGRRLSMHAGGRGDVMEITHAEDWRAAMADLFHIELSVEEVERLGLF